MRYDEYKLSAQKHLNACKKIVESQAATPKVPKSLLIELWYLSGYIIEGLVVYSIYKQNGWESDKDIEKTYDFTESSNGESSDEFTKRTGIDFYRSRRDGRSGKEHEWPVGGKPKYNVQSHNFQVLIQNLLRNRNEFDNVPYFGNNTIIDEDIKKMLNQWGTHLRYSYEGQDKNKKIIDDLSFDTVTRLIKTCEEIYTEIQMNIG